MNQEKISQLIKNLRKKNNLTQEAFAKEFKVSYQAVSKWENGKNLPDINVLKEICDKYNLDINEFLSGNEKNKKNKKKKNIIIGIVILLIVIIAGFILISRINKKDDFVFEPIHAECDNFNITGVLAYNDVKSSIYISELSYCGEKDDTLYNSISCTLYETTGDINKSLSSYKKEDENGFKLEDYLKEVKFNVDNYDKICKTYNEDNLYLEIEAKDKDGKVTKYHVPLSLDSNCSK